MNARARIALTIVLALAAVLLLSATPAWAVSGPVPGDPVINGRHLGGLTDTEARSAIQTASAVPKLGYVYLKAKGLPFAFDATKTIVVDVDATLIHAYDATVVPSYELTPTLKVSGAAPAMVTKWVLAIAKKVDGPAVNSRYYVRYRRLACITARNGGYLYWRTAIGMVLNLLKKEAAMGGAEQPRLNLPMSIIKPRVTSGNIQKAILVVLGDRYLFLYQGTRQLEFFRCAVGMRSYPTPTGVWKVVGKKMWPSWYNPGGAWGAGMPSYIGPGPNNPLGTRAIYLSADGIRIHGTANRSSIGHAASHGCIRMLRENVEHLYPQVPIGASVYIIK